MGSRRSLVAESTDDADRLVPKEKDGGAAAACDPTPLPDLPKAESLDDDVAFGLPPFVDDVVAPLGGASGDDSPAAARHREIIAASVPSTALERALRAELDRQVRHNERLVGECTKLRSFISKRKQTYKRKRKDESAPRKKLSGYNLFVRERFAKIAKANEDALRSADSGAELKRIPPASNIASSGRAWSQLSAEEKARYNEMAKPDEDRFQKETADYTAPEKLNRKRAKTGYNVFFSKHVLELKQNEGGVPSERGSVARIVGDAWKKMTAEEKDEYERQADQQNEMSHSEDDAEPRPQHNLHHPLPHPNQHPPPPHMIMNGMVVGLPGPPSPHQHVAMGLPPPPGPDQMHPPPPMDEHGPPPPGPPVDPNLGPVDPNMPPPYPPEYSMPAPPPPVIHQPPGYEPGYGAYPPFDPYVFPPNYQGGPPPPPYPGMPPPPGYGPPPPNYQAPPPPYQI